MDGYRVVWLLFKLGNASLEDMLDHQPRYSEAIKGQIPNMMIDHHIIYMAALYISLKALKRVPILSTSTSVTTPGLSRVSSDDPMAKAQHNMYILYQTE